MHLTLHLTRACNLRCNYCYAPPMDGAPMSFATGRQALELGSRLNRGSCGIVFFGGERLLCKGLIRELVACGRELERFRAGRFHFKVTTNGMLVDEAFLEFAVREDLFVAMSFDGTQAAHDAHRRTAGGAGSFGVLLPRLRRLLAARPYASVLMVVNPDTAVHLAESVEFLLEEGARYLILSVNHAGPWTEEALEILGAEYQKLAQCYIAWTRAGRKFYLSPFEVKLSSHINRHCYQKDRCELGLRQLSVDPDGWLYPCVQFVKGGPGSRWCVGHVRTGVDEAACARLHAESGLEKPECRDCALRLRCNNSCGCLNWQTTGRVSAVSPSVCRHEQMLMPIADRVGRDLYRRRDPHFLHKHYNAAYPVLSMIEDALSAERKQ
jgi:uncharacterized protein